MLHLPAPEHGPLPRERMPDAAWRAVDEELPNHAVAEIDAARTGRGVRDFRPLLANMRPVVRGADLAICHMETPLAPQGGPFAGYVRLPGGWTRVDVRNVH